MAKMNVNPNNCLIKKIMGIIQHYDSDKYWKRRKIAACLFSRQTGIFPPKSDAALRLSKYRSVGGSNLF